MNPLACIPLLFSLPTAQLKVLFALSICTLRLTHEPSAQVVLYSVWAGTEDNSPTDTILIYMTWY